MLTHEEVRLLDRVTFGTAGAAAAASASGIRRAQTHGVGIEFHEFRPYQPGDDPRLIDWTVEARLDQLFVRVSRADGSLRLHVLVDVSRSMSVGTPDKLRCARKLAAAMAYLAVEHRDSVGLSTFDKAIRRMVAAGSGRAQLFRLLEMLNATTDGDVSAIDDALVQFGGLVRGPGIVVVLSDFLAPGAGVQGLGYLLHRGLTPVVLQVVAPEDIDPKVTDLDEVFDVERPGKGIVVSDATLADYRRRFAAHTATLRDFCVSQRLPFAQIDSSLPFRALLDDLDAAGVLATTAVRR